MHDTETVLCYLQSRYYNPEWGRFINADAIAGQVGELLSHNLFAYCKNNPVNLEDSSGFSPSEMYPQGGGGWGGPASFSINKIPFSFRPLNIRESFSSIEKINKPRISQMTNEQLVKEIAKRAEKKNR